MEQIVSVGGAEGHKANKMLQPARLVHAVSEEAAGKSSYCVKCRLGSSFHMATPQATGEIKVGFSLMENSTTFKLWIRASTISKPAVSREPGPATNATLKPPRYHKHF